MRARDSSTQSSIRKTDACGKYPAGIVIPCLIISCLLLISCHKKATSPIQQARSAAPQLAGSAPSPSSDEQSCRAFVQNFYDWYWNRYAESANSVGFDTHSLPTVETVLKRKPTVLSDELSQLISEDRKKMLASHEVGNLDFDPFWGNQDAQGMYKVGRISVTGDRCKASIPQGDEIVELQKLGPSWVFVNIYYCFTAFDSTRGRHCPDTDLIEVLKR